MAVLERSASKSRRAERKRVRLIDCDVHNAMVSPEVLKHYLPSRWHVYADQGANVPPHGTLMLGARPPSDFYRNDSVPAEGPPGSDFELMREQLLDAYDVHKAILHPVSDLVRIPLAGEVGLALTAALNDWMVEEWLSRDDRLWGGISVPLEDGARAAREIARCAADPRFVKVTLPAKTAEGLGHPKYWPIYEAAEQHGLPVSVHVGGFSGHATATGWPNYFVEYQCAHLLDFQAQLASLVCRGVFQHFPRLQIVFEEAGIGWIAPALWRLDRSWAIMRDEVPELGPLAV